MFCNTASSLNTFVINKKRCFASTFNFHSGLMLVFNLLKPAGSYQFSYKD